MELFSYAGYLGWFECDSENGQFVQVRFYLVRDKVLRLECRQEWDDYDAGIGRIKVFVLEPPIRVESAASTSTAPSRGGLSASSDKMMELDRAGYWNNYPAFAWNNHELLVAFCENALGIVPRVGTPSEPPDPRWLRHFEA